MISNGFEILGVAQDATPEEIKKAYYKLIRIHSPEKDPEGFKKIHAAYEAVLSGEMVGRPDFPVKSEEEQRLIQQLEDYLDHKQFALARDMGEKVLKKKPQLDYVRYLTGIAQRECGNYVKSSNSFLKLLDKYPDNQWLEREACISYCERGWKNKGAVIGELAYSHGCHDIRFITSFLDCVYTVDGWRNRNPIVESMTVSYPKWNRDNYRDAFTSFNYVVPATLTAEERRNIVKGLRDFLDQMGNTLVRNTDWLATRMGEFLFLRLDTELAEIVVPYYNKLISMAKDRYIQNGLIDEYPKALDLVLKKRRYPTSFLKAVEAYNKLLYSRDVRLARKKNETAIQERYDSILISCIENRKFLGEHAEELHNLIPDIWKKKNKFFDALGNESISNEELCKLV